MMNFGLPEMLILSVLWVIPVLILYFVIRLAVRHGVIDAHQRLPQQHRPDAPAQ
jgi:hypothetical protein